MYLEDIIREKYVIERIKEAFPESGIGDDTAVLPSIGGDLLFASDAVVEGVHFRRIYSTLSQAVQKAVTSNVSDIYAMGGKPLKILLTAGLPAGCDETDIEDVIDGLKKGSKAYGLELAGGDTVFSPGGFFFDISVIGQAESGAAVKRSGGMKGDTLVVFGECGGSLAGFSFLGSIFDSSGGKYFLDSLLPADKEEIDGIKGVLPNLSILTTSAEIRKLAEKTGLHGKTADIIEMIMRHIVPRAVRLDDRFLAPGGAKVTAMTDISDGLAEDLASLCGASSTGALIDAESIPLPAFLVSGEGIGEKERMELSLTSGEEYSQLAAVRDLDKKELPEGAAIIGELTGQEEGMMIRGSDGIAKKIVEAGFEHDFK